MSGDGAGDSLFRHLLGAADLDRLPSPIRRLHLQQGRTRYSGEVEVIRGDGLLSRLCGWVTRLPPAGRGPIRVDIEANGLRETWTRHVAGHAMRSQLRADAGVLVERLGLVAFRFQLAVRDDAIVWSVVGGRCARIGPAAVARALVPPSGRARIE